MTDNLVLQEQVADIRFKCPECGCEQLEEIRHRVTQTHLTVGFNANYDTVKTKIGEWKGEVKRFCCHNEDCNFVVTSKRTLRHVNNEIGLKEWLEANGMLKVYGTFFH